MGIELIAHHWIYGETARYALVCIFRISLLALFTTINIATLISDIFNSFIFAITELMSTILVYQLLSPMKTVEY